MQTSVSWTILALAIAASCGGVCAQETGRKVIHVTVVVPKLGQGCLIGRTGRVFFDDAVLEPRHFDISLPEAES